SFVAGVHEDPQTQQQDTPVNFEDALWDQHCVSTPKECTIDLTDCPAAFIPQGRAVTGTNAGDPGNDVTFTATVTAGGPRKIRFFLEGVSSEPGICMNFGTETDRDLKFRQTATINPAADFDAPSADGQTITTKNKVNSITVTVTSYDYGSYGTIKAC